MAKAAERNTSTYAYAAATDRLGRVFIDGDAMWQTDEQETKNIIVSCPDTYYP
jgi:hypothetical protein